MIKPTIGDLLKGVVASLRESVLPEVPLGPTRKQLEAAISILRRLSLVWEKTGPYLSMDNRDIEDTLRGLIPLLEKSAAKEQHVSLTALSTRLRTSLAPGDATSGEYPSPETLGARNVALQGLLADLQETIHETVSSESLARIEIETRVRVLFRRMLERELAITQPARRR